MRLRRTVDAARGVAAAATAGVQRRRALSLYGHTPPALRATPSTLEGELPPKLLSLGKTQINLLLRSLIRNVDYAEVTLARQNSNKFVFALAYS